MKLMIAVMVGFFASSAFACLPTGDKLNNLEKTEFANELRRLNPACARKIPRAIGILSASDVNVYEKPDDNVVFYVVRGAKSQMAITKIKVKGRLSYECGSVTGLPRCL